jgi:recombination protein RecR
MAAGEPSGAVGRLIQELGRLPGIGPKSAERIAHHLLATEKGKVLALADAIRQVKEAVHHCRQCFNLTETDLCPICADARRDQAQICVVEQPRDLMAIERAGVYRGVYHVLLGRLAPLENVGPEQLTVDALLRRVQAGGANEVILATNPTTEGDGTALYVSNLLAPLGVKLTRLARGLSSGSGLEFASKDVLADALEGRRVF